MANQMYQEDSEEIARKQALAQMLRQQSMTPIETQSVGGIPTPISPLQGIAKMYEGYQSGQMDRKLAEERKQASQKYTAGLADALNKYQSDGDVNALVSSNHPVAQQVGISRMTADQASKSASQKMAEEYRLKREFALDPDVNAAKQKLSPQKSDYFVPIQTADGIQSFDSRRGTASPLIVGGNRIVGSGSDPRLQGNIAGAKEASKTEAELRTKSAVGLPDTIARTEQTIGLIDSLISHPGMSTVVGSPGLTGIPAKFGMAIPGTDAAGFTARLDQLKGKQFLEAFESLKGGGQITQIEGEKATDALSRLTKTGQSEKEYRAAANELKGYLKTGLERAKQKAGGTAGQNSTSQNGTASIKSDDDYNNLPSGTLFIGPDGKTRRKP
jgi:hypothetical protein